MGLTPDYIYGQTPLDESERGDLIPKWVETNEELYSLEYENIISALKLLNRKRLNPTELLNMNFVKKLPDILSALK